MLSLEYIFRSILVTPTPSVSLMNGNVVAKILVLNRVSGHEKKAEKGEKVVQKGNGVLTNKEDEAANLLPYVEEKLGNLCCSCPQ